MSAKWKEKKKKTKKKRMCDDRAHAENMERHKSRNNFTWKSHQIFQMLQKDKSFIHGFNKINLCTVNFYFQDCYFCTMFMYIDIIVICLTLCKTVFHSIVSLLLGKTWTPKVQKGNHKFSFLLTFLLEDSSKYFIENVKEK